MGIKDIRHMERVYWGLTVSAKVAVSILEEGRDRGGMKDRVGIRGTCRRLVSWGRRDRFVQLECNQYQTVQINY